MTLVEFLPLKSQKEIHEIEAILKLTSDYITEGENLPGNSSLGLNNHTLDYAQGYGLVNADNAVALALTLQRMRDENGDGLVDNEDVEVLDAFKIFKETMKINTETFSTSGLKTNWDGDFAVFTSESDLPRIVSSKGVFRTKGNYNCLCRFRI